MSKIIGQFGIRVTRMEKADELPFNPFLQVVVAQWSCNQDERAPIISANLMSDAEIDEHFNNLVADLEATRKWAKEH